MKVQPMRLEQPPLQPVGDIWISNIGVTVCFLWPPGLVGFGLAKIYDTYRKISNIRRAKSTNSNVSRLVLQLSLPNQIKPGVKSRMKMWLEQRRQAMLQLHLSDR